MKKLLGLASLLLVAACAPGPSGEGEGGANANDRSDGNAEGDRLETGAMAVSPSGAYIVARRSSATLIVDVREERVTELPLVGERFVFSKTREVVYAVLADLRGVVALDLATSRELWRAVPAFKTRSGAFLAKVTDDDTTLLVADYDRLFRIDAQTGDVRGATPAGGIEPVDLELLPGDHKALVVNRTAWRDGGPHTPVSLVDVDGSTSTTIDVPNCAAPIEIALGGARALLSPTFCTADAEARAKGWSNPDPVSVIDVDGTAGTLRFVKNLPGFGPVSMLADGRAVAYLDTKRMDPSMFDDASQVPGAGAVPFHLMLIEPRTMAFALHPIGDQLPRFAPSKDGRSLLVDASVVVTRNEASASITFDPATGTLSASVKGAFGDASGSLFGVFDLETRTYTPFAGPAASLDRFVQLGDGSQIFTLKENASGGDLFGIDLAARTSTDLGMSARDIGILPDGRTLVLRLRMEADAEGRVREAFCLSTDGRTCTTRIEYRSAVPTRD